MNERILSPDTLDLTRRILNILKDHIDGIPGSGVPDEGQKLVLDLTAPLERALRRYRIRSEAASRLRMAKLPDMDEDLVLFAAGWYERLTDCGETDEKSVWETTTDYTRRKLDEEEKA